MCLSALLTWFSACSCLADEGLTKQAYCGKAVPRTAYRAYCAVWRSRCEEGAKEESQSEIVRRIFFAELRGFTDPLNTPTVGLDDIKAMVEAADQLKPSGEHNNRGAFMAAMKRACFDHFDEINKSITR